ncbi:MAG: C40 family peptidase [Vicinamibacterales bacterium]
MRRLILLLVIALAGAACATTGGVPRPFPTPGGVPSGGVPPAPPRPGATPPAGHGTVDGYAITSTALALRGAPYRNGGDSPRGFDCSGFVQYVFGQNGLALPRQVHDQFRVGESVNASALEPGDLVFFSTVAPGASHVGIALGGDQFVHAPSSNGVVRVEALSTSYWAKRFVGAKRVN